MIEQTTIPVSPNCPLCRTRPVTRRECGYCAEEATLSNMATGATKMIEQTSIMDIPFYDVDIPLTCANCHQVVVSEPGDTCADIPQWRRGAFAYCEGS